jgi:hypothetical protein
MNSRRKRMVGVTDMYKVSTYVPKSLLGNPAGKFRCAWKDNIKISL